MQPGAGAAARPPGFFERRRRRARLREQLAVREEMLLELGALVFELHRQGQRAPELLQARAAELDAVDAEVRAMEESLAGGDPSAWPSEESLEWSEAGEWDAGAEQTGEWDAVAEQTGGWDPVADQTGDWDPVADQTGEWAAVADQTGDWDGAEGEWDRAEDEADGAEGEWPGAEGEADEAGEWVEDDDPGATQEWSVDEALDADDVTADPHDPAAEDAVPGDPSPQAPAEDAADDPPAEERA